MKINWDEFFRVHGESLYKQWQEEQEQDREWFTPEELKLMNEFETYIWNGGILQ